MATRVTCSCGLPVVGVIYVNGAAVLVCQACYRQACIERANEGVA